MIKKICTCKMYRILDYIANFIYHLQHGHRKVWEPLSYTVIISRVIKYINSFRKKHLFPELPSQISRFNRLIVHLMNLIHLVCPLVFSSRNYLYDCLNDVCYALDFSNKIVMLFLYLS